MKTAGAILATLGILLGVAVAGAIVMFGLILQAMP